MKTLNNILVVGSGVAGMEAALMLSKRGKKVYLVEQLPLIGGKTIKNEETFPDMDCSTCLVAPIQQDILQDQNIEVLTFSDVYQVSGEAGNYLVKIKKKARYVSLEACLGCGMCYPVCPVSQSNEWEEDLTDVKAIYVSCSGSLPNVPVIDAEKCLRLNGSESCNKCFDACMFGAIDFSQKDEEIELKVSGIILATGSDMYDVSQIENYGYGKYSSIYTAYEFERLFASNGPTEGKLTLRDGKTIPKSIAIIHCVGRKDNGYCSNICCMYSAKHSLYLKHKIPDAKIYNIYSDICLPEKSYQEFYENVKETASEYIYCSQIPKINIEEEGNSLKILYMGGNEKINTLEVEMVILANGIVPNKFNKKIADIYGIELDKYGFIATQDFRIGSVMTSRTGILVAGTAEGPKDIQNSVIQAEAAVSGILSLMGN